MYRHMLRSRLLDERLWVLNRQGRAPFWISAEGHEAVQVAFGMNLKPQYDWVAPYYRDLALTLVLGMTPKDHILSVLQRAADPNSGGRQMPAHYGCRRLNIISTGSSVGTQLIHACGIALASRMRGEDAVTFTSIGEGGTSEGDFHEALNFAATHKLAVIFLVENNGFAISVPWQKQMPTPGCRRPCQGIRHPRCDRRRLRRHRLLPGGPRGGEACASRRRADAHRGEGAPADIAQLRRRPASLPDVRGARVRQGTRTRCCGSRRLSRSSVFLLRVMRRRCAPSW